MLLRIKMCFVVLDSFGTVVIFLFDCTSDSQREASYVHFYLEASSQELVLHLQEIAFIRLRFERLVDDRKLGIVLDVLPPGVAVAGKGVKGHAKDRVYPSSYPVLT